MMKITIEVSDSEIVRFLSANPAILQKIADSGVEKRRRKKPQSERAKELIWEALSSVDSLPAADIEFMGAQEGISRTTLHRARKSFGCVTSFREGFGADGASHWKIENLES